MKINSFYQKKPIFGLDIGSETVKLMQLEPRGYGSRVKAFGMVKSDNLLLEKGVIIKVSDVAKIVDNLIANSLSGELSTNRVAICIPASYVYTRVITLPMLSKKELIEAVRLEVEQSVPVNSKDLYYHFDTSPIGDGSQQLVRLEAVSRKIVDSYLAVCDLLGLELVLVQTNIWADAKLCQQFEDLDPKNPYVIIDVGRETIDIGLLDKTLRATGTVEAGGNDFTEAIAKSLHLSHQKAHEIKIKKGINPGPQQEKILKNITPVLDKVVIETKRIIRFYNDRIREDAAVSQVIILGGGANMPGLAEYFTNSLRVATRISSPWSNNITFGKLEPPERSDLPRFLSCAGLALAKDEEVTNL